MAEILRCAPSPNPRFDAVARLVYGYNDSASSAAGHAGAYLLIADYYLNLSWEFEKAVVWYTKYLALRPEDAKAQRRLGVAYLKVRDYSRIMDYLLGSVRKHPAAVELMPIVAISAIEQDKPDVAMAFFEDYIAKLAPEVRHLYEDIALVASSEEPETGPARAC